MFIRDSPGDLESFAIVIHGTGELFLGAGHVSLSDEGVGDAALVYQLAADCQALLVLVDGRTTWRPGYAQSQRVRKRVEEIFGWMKTVGGFRRTRYRGLDRTGLAGYLVATAYNLVRMAKLLAPTQEAPAVQAA